ncbi:MAG: hypothetical protein ACRC62_15710 [Microcoleus sp.]
MFFEFINTSIGQPKKMAFSAELLKTFEAFAQTIDLGVLCLGDVEGKPIIFSSKIKDIFEYYEAELTGKSLSVLLHPDPESEEGRAFTARHDKLMESFKLGEFASASRGMAHGRAVSGYTKAGEKVSITIAISYHKGGGEETGGIFLALVKLGDRAIEENTESVQSVFTALLQPGVAVVRKTKAAIAKQIIARGGVVGFVVWVASLVTPLGTSLKAFFTAFQWQASTGQEADVGVYEVIDNELRGERLKQIRNALHRVNGKVRAVAYYRFEEYGLGRQLRYVADSGTIDSLEAWFYDTTEERLILSEDALRSLNQMDCILVSNGGHYPKTNEKFNVVMCPTIRVEPDVQNNGLKRFVAVGVVAIAVDKTVELEPIATILWRYLPSVENLY